MGELAIAAGGTLWLDSAEEYRAGDLLALCNTWAMMRPECRPTIYFALTNPDEERARPDQPKVKVTTHLLFHERIVRAQALAAQQL